MWNTTECVFFASDCRVYPQNETMASRQGVNVLVASVLQSSRIEAISCLGGRCMKNPGPSLRVSMNPLVSTLKKWTDSSNHLFQRIAKKNSFQFKTYAVPSHNFTIRTATLWFQLKSFKDVKTFAAMLPMIGHDL